MQKSFAIYFLPCMMALSTIFMGYKENSMESIKKLVSATLIAAVLFSSTTLQAASSSSSNGGVGYEESRRAPSIAPAVALGTIALIAIIAVAVQNSNEHNHTSQSN
jgi:hypothetical protein